MSMLLVSPLSPVEIQDYWLACDDDAGAVVEAASDGGLADDVRVGGAVGVGHVVQRPRHAEGPALAVGRWLPPKSRRDVRGNGSGGDGEGEGGGLRKNRLCTKPACMQTRMHEGFHV